MNPTAILALIGDLYTQIATLNAELEKVTAQRDALIEQQDQKASD